MQRHHHHSHLFKYPNSQVWWMYIKQSSGGRALRESTGFRDAAEANAEYHRRITRGSLDRDAPAKKERSLGDALRARLTWLRTNRKNDDPTRKKLSEASISFYAKKSGTLVRVLGETMLLSEITPEVIRDYITKRTDEGTKGTTIAKELTTLSMAVKLAHKDGVSCALIRDMKPEDFRTTYVPRERYLTRAEYDRFMVWWYAHRSPNKGAVIDFIVSTGATYPSEVDHFSRERDANVETFEVHIRGTKRAKRDRTFIVPSDRRNYFSRAMLHKAFAPWGNIRRDLLIACAYLSMCEDCRQGHRLFWRDGDTCVPGTSQKPGTPVRDPKCRACRTVEVFEPFCPTDLRRTFAQWLMQAGVPYELAYPLMGHEDDRMLKKVYGKRTASDVSPLIEAALARHGGEQVVSTRTETHKSRHKGR